MLAVSILRNRHLIAVVFGGQRSPDGLVDWQSGEYHAKHHVGKANKQAYDSQWASKLSERGEAMIHSGEVIVPQAGPRGLGLGIRPASQTLPCSTCRARRRDSEGSGLLGRARTGNAPLTSHDMGARSVQNTHNR
jgi:hypothetical protein